MSEQPEGPARRPSAASLLHGDRRRRELLQLPRSALVNRDYEQDIKLKKWYAIGVLIFLAAQLLATNVIFVLYAWWGADWVIEPSVIQTWLAATVVQVVGVVLVVTRYLFPRRDLR